MNVIVNGPLNFDDSVLLTKILNQYSSRWDKKNTKIIVKGDKGFPRFVKEWCFQNWYNMGGFHSDPKNLDEDLNLEMVDYCSKDDWCVVFHDGKCYDNKDLIKKAEAKGLIVEVIDYNN